MQITCHTVSLQTNERFLVSSTPDAVVAAIRSPLQIVENRNLAVCKFRQSEAARRFKNVQAEAHAIRVRQVEIQADAHAICVHCTAS